MILTNLTSPSNDSPTIMATSINGSLTASLIKTVNLQSNIEQIYIAVEDTTSGVWDRIMIFGGKPNFKYVVGTTLSFQSIISCALQITSVESSPQRLENLSFSIDYAYAGIQGLKLSFVSLPEFFREYTIPLPFVGYDPFPFMDTDGTLDVAAYYIDEFQRYEIFTRGGDLFSRVTSDADLTNCVYLTYNGTMFEVYDGTLIKYSADGITWI